MSAFQRAETMSLGADNYVATNDSKQWESVKTSLDVLIITINASVDWTPYINSMRPNGVMVFVGAINDKPFPLQIFGPFIARQVTSIRRISQHFLF